MRVHLWALYNTRQEHYAAQTELALKCRDALAARCHLWACRRSFPSLSATLRRELTQLLELIIRIGTTTYLGHKKMACYSRTVVLRSNFTGRIQLYPAVFLQ